MITILLTIFFVVVFSFWHQSKQNRYIAKHKEKNTNDNQYLDYTNWCLKNCEIPMSKVCFNKEIEDKENQIKNLFK